MVQVKGDLKNQEIYFGSRKENHMYGQEIDSLARIDDTIIWKAGDESFNQGMVNI